MALETTVKIHEHEVKVVLPGHDTLLMSGFRKPGQFVKVRPVTDNAENLTYLGIYLGDIALGYGVLFEDNTLTFRHLHYNPGIFVPQLSRIVYGMESWWGPITSKEDLEKLASITDEDIRNVWYVKALQQLAEAEATKKEASQTP